MKRVQRLKTSIRCIVNFSLVFVMMVLFLKVVMNAPNPVREKS